VARPEQLVQAVRIAAATAERGLLTTIGITPTRPETGYGYLRCGDLIGDGPARKVEEFTEKPSADMAEAYLRSGRYFWNASMFVWRVDAFLAELARQQPAMYAGLTAVAQVWHAAERDDVLNSIWPTLPRISVDYALMEGAAAAGRVATVPGDFGWTDVGDFHTLGEVLPANGSGNVVVGAEAADGPGVLLCDADSLVVVPRSGRLVAALGVHDMVIVDTPDALLVCPRNRAQDVKKLVDELKERGEDGLV
jgi:mannose-1-phosphate guanylyltransferase